MDAAKAAASAAATTVQNAFAGLSVSIAIERELEATVLDPTPSLSQSMLAFSTPDPLRIVVPVIERGKVLKGTVTLTAPPGCKRVFSGLTLSLHCVKAMPAPPKKDSWLPQEPPKPTDPLVYERVYESVEPLVALAPGRYEVNGDIVVPFEMPTDGLPPIESLETSFGGGVGGVWHWVEAHVSKPGAAGYVRRARDGWRSMKKQSDRMRATAEMGDAMKAFTNQGNKGNDNWINQPAGAAHARFCLQALTPPPAATTAPNPWLTVGDFGGKCRLELIDGSVHALGASTCVRASLVLEGTAPLRSVELRLVTSLVGEDYGVATRTAVVWSKELADALAAADKATESSDAAAAPAAAAPAAAEGDASGGSAPAEAPATAEAAPAAAGSTGGISLNQIVSLPLGAAEGVAAGAQAVCRGAYKQRVNKGPPEEEGKGTPFELTHTLQLRLIAQEEVDGKPKEGYNGVPLRLVRTEPSGAAVGELLDEVPPPSMERPLWLRIILKVLLAFLGLFSFVVMLSFMAPQKATYACQLMGITETAEFLGVIPDSKNGTGSHTARSMVAAGTQQVRRFLGAAGRRM